MQAFHEKRACLEQIGKSYTPLLSEGAYFRLRSACFASMPRRLDCLVEPYCATGYGTWSRRPNGHTTMPVAFHRTAIGSVPRYWATMPWSDTVIKAGMRRTAQTVVANKRVRTNMHTIPMAQASRTIGDGSTDSRNHHPGDPTMAACCFDLFSRFAEIRFPPLDQRRDGCSI